MALLFLCSSRFLGRYQVLKAACDLCALNHVPNLNVLQQSVTLHDIAKRRETSVHEVAPGSGQLGIKEKKEELGGRVIGIIF